ncbi:hypothetical protein ACLOJK_021732 [Asimina triloba]
MEEILGSSSISPHQNQYQPNQPATSNPPPETNCSPLGSRIRKLLFRKMLVGVNDGRFFLGGFHCMDKQGNIILQDAVEYRSTRKSSPSPMEQRCLGLILIPSSCRSSSTEDSSVVKSADANKVESDTFN